MIIVRYVVYQFKKIKKIFVNVVIQPKRRRILYKTRVEKVTRKKLSKMSATSANVQPVEVEERGSQRDANLLEAESNIANCDNRMPAEPAMETRGTSQGVENKASTSSSQDNQGSENDGGINSKPNTNPYEDKVNVSTQLYEHKSEEKDDEDNEDKERLEQGAHPHPQQDQTQLQGELLRQVLIRETLAAAQKILLEEPELMVGFMSDFTESMVNVSMVTVRNDQDSTLELEEASDEDEAKAQVQTSGNSKANVGEKEALDKANGLEPRKELPSDAASAVDPSTNVYEDCEYEEEGMKKKEVKEKEAVIEEKDEKKAKEKVEEGKEEKEDDEVKEKKDEEDKTLPRRKRKRDQGKAGAEEVSSSLEIDDDPSPDASNAKEEPAAKKTKREDPSESMAVAAPNDHATKVTKVTEECLEGKVSHHHPDTLTPSLAPLESSPRPTAAQPNASTSSHQTATSASGSEF